MCVDVIQIGARNMQNFELLKEVGAINKPILLKRGLSNTIEEWLMSAEYNSAPSAIPHEATCSPPPGRTDDKMCMTNVTTS